MSCVFGGDPGIERLPGVLHRLAGGGFPVDQVGVGIEQLALVGGLRVASDRGQPGLDAELGQFALVILGLVQQALLAAVFLVQLLHLAADGVALGFLLLDGGLLGGEIAGDDQGRRDQVGVGFAVCRACQPSLAIIQASSWRVSAQ